MTPRNVPPKDERERLLDEIAFFVDQLKDLEMQEAAQNNSLSHIERQKQKLQEKIKVLAERLKGK